MAELGPSTAGQIEAHLAGRAARREGSLVGPQRHQVGGRGVVGVGGADDGHAGRIRAALRPDRAGAAAGGAGPSRSTTTRRCASSTLRAATALGVGTEADIRDYFRLRPRQVKPAIAGLVAGGRTRTRRGRRMDGTGLPACRARRCRAGTAGTALLCPFDPLIFFRPRVRAAVRLPLPHRDLHAGGQAAIRLLRVAVAARRPVGRPSGPQGRPPGRDALHAVAAFIEQRATRGRGAAHGGRTAVDGVMAGLSDVTVGERGDLAAGVGPCAGVL